MKALYLFFLVVLLSPACFLHAQMDERPLMKVSIPFAFTIENARLPAGSYIIYGIETDHLWRFSSSGHKQNVLFHIVTDTAVQRFANSKLIFDRYPTDYVLRKIDSADNGVVASLSVSKRERQLAAYSRPLEEAVIDAQSE